MTNPILIIGMLAAGGLILPGLGFGVKSFKQRHAWVTTIVILMASMAASLISLVLPQLQILQIFAPRELIKFDALGLFFAVTVLIVSIFVAVSSADYMRDDPNPHLYYSMLLFTALGMVLLAFANDLLVIFVAWEVMGIPTFILTGFKKKDPASNEAAVKFFVLGALSAGILLYSISLLFGITGTTNLEAIFKVLSQPLADFQPLALLAVALFIAAFGLKMAIVPFHMWIPDAYEGAPTTVSTLLAAGTKKAGFIVGIRVFLVALSTFKVDWTITFAILAVFTMTWGNIAALTQRNITRLLAYSSIGQAGYILMGLAVVGGGTEAATLGLSGALFHVLNHAIMKSSAFIAAALIVHKVARADLDFYKGIGFRMPFTSFNFTIALLALAGIPPLSGFWSKFIIFSAAIQAEMAWLALAGVLNSAFSLAYYAWIIKRMYIDEPLDKSRIGEPKTFTSVMLVSTLLLIVLGIFPDVVLEYARKAVLDMVPYLK